MRLSRETLLSLEQDLAAWRARQDAGEPPRTAREEAFARGKVVGERSVKEQLALVIGISADASLDEVLACVRRRLGPGVGDPVTKYALFEQIGYGERGSRFEIAVTRDSGGRHVAQVHSTLAQAKAAAGEARAVRRERMEPADLVELAALDPDLGFRVRVIDGAASPVDP